MNRRDWLKRTSLALAGGLVLGDAAMEAYERLTHKKVWALGGAGPILFTSEWIASDGVSDDALLDSGNWQRVEWEVLAGRATAEVWVNGEYRGGYCVRMNPL